MFGNLSTPAAGTGTTGGFGTRSTRSSTEANTDDDPGGGAFGNTANASTSAFGAKPAGSGFGAFGGGGTTGTPSAFGGTTTGAFGQPAATTTTTGGLFGQPAASTTGTSSAFGGGGLFGQNKPATSAFGTGTYLLTISQSPAYLTTSLSCSGSRHRSASSSYDWNCQPHIRGAPRKRREPDCPVSIHRLHASLCRILLRCMSRIFLLILLSLIAFQELRLQDYSQGRKTASATGAFGATPSAFGSTPSAQPSTGLFGATPAQPATSAFGQTPAAPANNAFGAFGGTNTAAQPAAGGGLFGGGGTFGSTPAQPAATSSAFGGFGAQQQQQPQQSTGLFGGTGNTFGANANAAKPAGFGTFGATRKYCLMPPDDKLIQLRSSIHDRSSDQRVRYVWAK